MLTIQEIVNIKADCQQHTSKLYIFSIPIMETVYDTMWHNVANDIVYDRGKGLHRFRQAVEQEHITYIPIAESLQTSNQDNMLYIDWDGHLNESGARFVANEIFDYFIDSHVLP